MGIDEIPTTSSIIDKIKKERIETLEQFIDAGRRFLQEEPVLHLTESDYGSYRMFSAAPDVNEYLHADATVNQGIILAMISDQPGQLMLIARKMGGESVNISAIDRKNNPRVVHVFSKKGEATFLG